MHNSTVIVLMKALVKTASSRARYILAHKLHAAGNN